MRRLERLKGRNPSKLPASAAAVKFEVPYERELPAWCKERAAALGVSIDDAGARRLVEAVGRDLAGLHGGLERLALFVGAGGRIGADAVEKMIVERTRR